MKIGFTCGAFDLLHAGHVVMLKEAKQNSDYLIVGLQTDPTLDRQEKNIQLQAIKYIDEIIPYDTEKSLLDLLESTPINIRFVGEDYENRSFTGEGWGETYYTSRKHSFSSTDLRERIKKDKARI